jgi:hypothetical protein
LGRVTATLLVLAALLLGLLRIALEGRALRRGRWLLMDCDQDIDLRLEESEKGRAA